MFGFISAVVFIEFILLTLVIHNFISKERREVEKRVTEVVGKRAASVREQELKAPLYRRAIKPLLIKMSTLMVKMLPAEKEAELGQKIARAGINEKIAPKELLVIKYLAAAGTAALLWTISEIMSGNPIQAVLMGCAGLGLGWLSPDFYVNRKGLSRKQEVEKNLPDVLDLLTVSVEAGLGFDGALMKVVEKTKGILYEEFTMMLQEIKMGRPRTEALRDLSKRTDVDDLSTFTGSVILADQLGISVGNILRLQSEQIRLKRRQRAEEMAMKAPVKMLIPMVLFIFPAIFVVLLGPAAIQISKAFR
ncbi:MAG: Bacterial type II secretion system protein F domain protein [Pelotomaculum sp. PtaU1.Bin035]|nr:MAG: Bacterial type II secretion system protein F domain protein [Pelotomaculum sp. PtaU1.Bin035]